MTTHDRLLGVMCEQRSPSARSSRTQRKARRAHPTPRPDHSPPADRARTAASYRSLRSATAWMSPGSFLENCRLNTFSVSESANDLIMLEEHNATRHAPSVMVMNLTRFCFSLERGASVQPGACVSRLEALSHATDADGAQGHEPHADRPPR